MLTGLFFFIVFLRRDYAQKKLSNPIDLSNSSELFPLIGIPFLWWRLRCQRFLCW